MYEANAPKGNSVNGITDLAIPHDLLHAPEGPYDSYEYVPT